MLRDGDDLAIVAAGITLHESLKAAEQLAGEGIEARVIDLYSVKPVDAETLRAAAEATGGRILTVEDHWPEGGIGDAVLEVLSEGDTPARVVRLAVREMPGSGKPAELLAAAGIDAEHIAVAARSLVGSTVERLEEPPVELALPLARGSVDLGPPRVGLVGLAERRGLRLDAEPLEGVDCGAARRALRHARRGHRPAEHVGEELDPPLAREQRVPRCDHLAHLGQRVGDLRQPVGDALEPGLQQVVRVGVEGEPGDRAGGPRVPARAAFAAQQRQEGQAVRVRLARLSVSSRSVRSSQA